MTYGRRAPYDTTWVPSAPVVRKVERIPAMQAYRGHRSRFTDEDVIQAILANKFGESIKSIAERLDTHIDVVSKWIGGISRRRCAMEADRRYPRLLAARRPPSR